MNDEIREHGPDRSPMVLVPAGPFLMGRPEGDFLAEDHEKPERQVELPAFWIDVFPVTNVRYGLFLATGGYADPAWWHPAGWAWRREQRIDRPLAWEQVGWDAPEQPVAGVSWFEADAYACWAGRRLPTDAEWEKAARGTDGRRYPWGNDWPSPALCNFDRAVGRTTPVGLYPLGVSPYGCHDMAGNVNNWVADWHWPEFGDYCIATGLLRDACLNDELRERLGLTHVHERVDRGGGFATAREVQEVLSCTRKVCWPPETRELWNGFRTARDATER